MNIQQKPVFARKSFASGDRIFSQGDIGEIAYIVQSGAVEISREVDDRKCVLGVIGQNTLFGEMALIDNRPRMATATATEPTTCLIISKDGFAARLAHSDKFMNAVVRTLVENVRSLSEIVDVSQRPPAAPEGLAAHHG